MTQNVLSQLLSTRVKLDSSQQIWLELSEMASLAATDSQSTSFICHHRSFQMRWHSSPFFYAQNRKMDDVKKKVNRKKGRKEGRQVGLARAPAAEHIDGSLSRQCVSQFEYFSHSLTRTNACMPKEIRKNEGKEKWRPARCQIRVSHACPLQRLREGFFLKLWFLPLTLPPATTKQRFKIITFPADMSMIC